MLALSMLVWAQKNRAAFFSDFFSKTIPTRAQLDIQVQTIEDDGRTLAMLQKFQDNFDAESAERAA